MCVSVYKHMCASSMTVQCCTSWVEAVLESKGEVNRPNSYFKGKCGNQFTQRAGICVSV